MLWSISDNFDFSREDSETYCALAYAQEVAATEAKKYVYIHDFKNETDSTALVPNKKPLKKTLKLR